jgi:hypothetical protein
MRLKIDMTLTAATAQRFRETAERLANMNLGDDSLLAATVLERIATSYDAAVIKTKMVQGAAEALDDLPIVERDNQGPGPA